MRVRNCVAVIVWICTSIFILSCSKNNSITEPNNDFPVKLTGTNNSSIVAVKIDSSVTGEAIIIVQMDSSFVKTHPGLQLKLTRTIDSIPEVFAVLNSVNNNSFISTTSPIIDITTDVVVSYDALRRQKMLSLIITNLNSSIIARKELL